MSVTNERSRRVAGALGVALALLVGCGGEGGGGPAPDGAAAGGAAADAGAGGARGDAGLDATGAGRRRDAGPVGPYATIVGALCALERTCCAQSGYPVTGLATCETSDTSGAALDSEIAAGTVVVDQAMLAACALAGQASDCLTGAQALQPCFRVFQGTLPEGSVCHGGDECSRSGTADVAFCFKQRPSGSTTEPDTGICHASPAGAAGEPCESIEVAGEGITLTDSVAPPTFTHCERAAGLFCNYTGTSSAVGTCTPLGQTGAQCFGSDGCAADAYCASNDTCQPRKPAGASCGSDENCQSGLTCTSGACTPGLVDEQTCTG
jgi:hypothetical protein